MEKWKLPDGWAWIPIREIADLYGGSTPKRSKSEYFNGEIVWITPTDLPKDGLIETVMQSKTTITQLGLDSCSAKLLPVGTILFSSRATIGKVAITGVELATNQGFINFVCRENVYNKYLVWALRTLTPQIKNLASSTTYLEISKRAMRSFPVPIPYPDDPARSLAEQRRIVARLDVLLGEVREMRELAEEMEQDIGRVMESALAEVFSDKERAKWGNEKPLGELVTITAPLVDPTLPEYRDLPHINGERIEEGTGRLLPYNTAAQDGMKSSKYFFQPGDVLYSKIRPYLRKATIVDFSGVCSADMYPLQVVTGELLPEFLKWGLLSRHFTEYAVGLSRRARMPKLNRKQLFAHRFRYPSKATQQAISVYLDQVLSEVTTLKDTGNENAQQLEHLEQSILAAAFRGEV